MNDDTLAPGEALSAFADGELDAAQVRDLCGRLAADPALRRALSLYKALDDAASRLKVPELAPAAAAKAWRDVAQPTSEVSAADQRAFARLEKAAAALPVPAVSAEVFEATWQGLAGRLHPSRARQQEAPALCQRAPILTVAAQLSEAPAPQPSARQWDEVWQAIRARAKLETTSSSSVARVDFSRRRSRAWRWLAAASLAAAVLLGLLIYVPWPSAEQTAVGMPEAPEVPEVLDDRYQVHVEYIEGQRLPVVCFLLKDDAGLGGEKSHNWNWLPE